MDRSRGLTTGTDGAASTCVSVCTDCGSHLGLVPAVSTGLLHEVLLRRCPSCGLRATCEAPPRRILTCASCKLFFADEPQAGDRCSGCRTEAFVVDVPETSVVAATELEVRLALAESWNFASAPATADYLRRVLRQVATGLDGAPDDGEIVLIDESRIRTLALPSGTILLSVGALGALENEAELAFVLAHELAHSASGDATTAFVRVGLRQLAQSQSADDREDWTQAALDLVRLGYGDAREYEADAQAMQALTLLGYDPNAVFQYFHRLRGGIAAGDPKLAELALAHPPPIERLRRLEGRRSLQTGASGIRVNRDVFRRAAGHTVLGTQLQPARPFEDEDTGEDRDRRGDRNIPRRAWLLVVLFLLIVLLALLLPR